MQEKLRKVTNAFKYVQATGVKVDADTLQRYEQIRKKVAKQLSVCIKFLQAQKAETPERNSSASSQTEKKDQKVIPQSPIQREHVSPIGGDTIPPSYRVTTPINMNGNGRGPTLTQSIKEREDALQKVHSITNGHGIKSNPARLETLSKQIIQTSDKKSLKVPSHATSQLTEFLLHNPDIIDPDQLDWDYEYPVREVQNGSYDSMSRKREIITSLHDKDRYPSVPTMGISALHSRNSVGTPKTPVDTPKRKPMNIRESNWRQGQSNVQGASDILRRDAVDWRRVKLPPGQKPPPNVTKNLPRFTCKFCHMKHSGRICPCKTCGWIHLTLKCPDIPYEAPETEDVTHKIICWSCGQKGHYARECPTDYDYRDFQPRERQDITPDEDTTYPLQISDKPHIVDGYLYRPATNSFVGKPSSYPVKSYASGQPTGGAYRKEKAPEKRGVKRNIHPHPQNNLKEVLEVVQVVLQVEDPQIKDLQVEDMMVMIVIGMMMMMMIDDDDDDDSDKEDDEYKQLKITPGQIPVKIGEKIFYVQPAIVEHDLLAPGGRASPPDLQVLEEEEVPLPLALQVLSLDLEVQKVIRVIKGIKVTREIEVQEVKKVIEEILVYKELLVCKLELEVFQ